MSNNWSVSYVQYPIGLSGMPVANHNIILVRNGDGQVVAQINGGPAGSDGNLANFGAEITPFISGTAPLRAQVDGPTDSYWNPSLGTGTTLWQGSQADALKMLDAAQRCVSDINNLGENYRLFTQNSNSVASTVYACMLGAEPPRMSEFRMQFGGDKILLPDSQINSNRDAAGLPPVGFQKTGYETEETLPDGSVETKGYADDGTLEWKEKHASDGKTIEERDYGLDGRQVALFDGHTDAPRVEIKLVDGTLTSTTHDPLDIRAEAYRTFTYDAAGRLDSDQIMNDNGTSSTAAYGDDGLLDSYLFHDAAGRVDSYWVYDANGKLDYNYAYDDANRPDFYYKYDTEGRVDSYWVYDDAAKIIYNYFYDDLQRANSYREYNTSYELTREFIFDETGKYDYSRTFTASGLMATLTEYDEAQRVDRHFTMDAQGKADYAYSYNDSGVATSLTDYNASQTIDAYYVYNPDGTYDYEYHYNAQGIETSFSDYGLNNKLESYAVFQSNGEIVYQYGYNDAGQIDQKLQYDTSGNIDYIQYFDSQNRLDLTQYYSNNVIENEYKYDDNNQLVKYIQHDASGNIDFIRHYDNQNRIDIVQYYTNNVIVNQDFYNDFGTEITQTQFYNLNPTFDLTPTYDPTPTYVSPISNTWPTDYSFDWRWEW